ncbi:hypothetical protein EDC01DRAFT_636039 [Geopyxis carbonaria]|nr:hypothetical protein EDC01DRAFT_636039 [Geopyxis carbonaria]
MLQQPELLRNFLEKQFRSTRLNVIPAIVIWVQHVPLQEQLDQIAESDAQYLVEAQANKVHNDNMLARQGKHCTRPTTLQELEVYRQEQAEAQSEPDVIPDVLQEWNQTEDSSDTISTAANTPPPLRQKKRYSKISKYLMLNDCNAEDACSDKKFFPQTTVEVSTITRVQKICQ